MVRIIRTLLPLVLLASTAAPVGAAQVSHTLPRGSTLETDAAEFVTTDRDTLDKVSIESQGSTDPSLEAYWSAPEFDVYFSYDPVGYIKMDDWQDVNVEQLWASYVDGTKQQSKEIGANVRPLGWIIKPTLDRAHSVAYYAIEAQFGDESPVVNMVIYDFGRAGYEQMTLVQPSADFAPAHAQIIANRVADAYHFAPGSQYADFKHGDKVAAIGAGGLIAAALGAKLGKGVLLVALLFLKKIWFLVLALPIALWKAMRGRFSSAKPS